MKTITSNRHRRSARKPGNEHAPRKRAITSAVPDGDDFESPSRVKVSQKNEKLTTGLTHPDAVIDFEQAMKAIGTADSYFCAGILEQIANMTWTDDGPDEHRTNFVLAVIKNIKPKDQIESMLVVQMAAVHMASMKFSRQLIRGVDTVQQLDSAERTFNKLTRTYATQMEALKRYRTGGEQKVTVQHVSVGEGGQAIVGNVTQTPHGNAPDKPRGRR